MPATDTASKIAVQRAPCVSFFMLATRPAAFSRVIIRPAHGKRDILPNIIMG